MFKNDPQNHNHFEMNLKLLYKQKLERERKLRISGSSDEEGGSKKSDLEDGEQQNTTD